MHQLRTNYGLFTDHGLLTNQLAVKFTIFCNYTDYSRTTDTEFLLVRKSVNGPCFVTGQPVIDLIDWGLTTCQPLWVILYRLPEKGRREIGDNRGDEREVQGRKENE